MKETDKKEFMAGVVLLIAGIAMWVALPILHRAVFPVYAHTPCRDLCGVMTEPHIIPSPVLAFVYAVYLIIMIASGIIGFVLAVTGAAQRR